MYTMTISTKYNVGERITWISNEHEKVVKGMVSAIEATAHEMGTEVSYTVVCDEGYKGRYFFDVAEGELFPEAYYQAMHLTYEKIRAERK